MEDSFSQAFFKISSPLSHEAFLIQNSLFMKEKSKVLWVIQKEKVVGKIHLHMLEEEYEPTLCLFENNLLILPEDYDSSLVEIFIRYFYFKEVNFVALFDIFRLFKLAIYLKVEELILKIIDFLNQNMCDLKKVLFIAKNAYELIGFFKKDDKKIFIKIIEDCSLFLIKNNYLDEFLACFNDKTMENISLFIEEIFQSLLRIMKNFQSPPERMLQFIVIFKEPLIKYDNVNINKEIYFKKILEENFDLSKIKFNEIQSYIVKLIDVQNLEIKDFINQSSLKAKIEELEQENLTLKMFLEKLQTNVDALNKKIDLETEISKETFKGLINNKEKTDSKLNKIENAIFDTGNLFLLINFPQFKMKKLLYDSLKDNKNKINEKVEGKKNVVILIETLENQIFGAYYTISLPKVTTPEGKYYKDENSCIFEISSNQIYKANKNGCQQLHTYHKWFYNFGNTENKDGIECDFNIIYYGGNKSEQYDGDSNFGVNIRKSSPVKKILIYQFLK